VIRHHAHPAEHASIWIWASFHVRVPLGIRDRHVKQTLMNVSHHPVSIREHASTIPEASLLASVHRSSRVSYVQLDSATVIAFPVKTVAPVTAIKPSEMVSIAPVRRDLMEIDAKPNSIHVQAHHVKTVQHAFRLMVYHSCVSALPDIAEFSVRQISTNAPRRHASMVGHVSTRWMDGDAPAQMKRVGQYVKMFPGVPRPSFK